MGAGTNLSGRVPWCPIRRTRSFPSRTAATSGPDRPAYCGRFHHLPRSTHGHGFSIARSRRQPLAPACHGTNSARHPPSAGTFRTGERAAGRCPRSQRWYGQAVPGRGRGAGRATGGHHGHLPLLEGFDRGRGQRIAQAHARPPVSASLQPDWSNWRSSWRCCWCLGSPTWCEVSVGRHRLDGRRFKAVGRASPPPRPHPR